MSKHLFTIIHDVKFCWMCRTVGWVIPGPSSSLENLHLGDLKSSQVFCLLDVILPCSGLSEKGQDTDRPSPPLPFPSDLHGIKYYPPHLICLFSLTSTCFGWGRSPERNSKFPGHHSETSAELGMGLRSHLIPGKTLASSELDQR
jgi:hypothetical protein